MLATIKILSDMTLPLLLPLRLFIMHLLRFRQLASMRFVTEAHFAHLTQSPTHSVEETGFVVVVLAVLERGSGSRA